MPPRALVFAALPAVAALLLSAPPGRSGAGPAPPLRRRRGDAPRRLGAAPVATDDAEAAAKEQLRQRVKGLLEDIPGKLSMGAEMPASTKALEAAYAADSHKDMYVNCLEFFMDLKINYDTDDATELLRPTVHACTDIDESATQEKLAPLYNAAMQMLNGAEPDIQLGIWRLVVDKLIDRVGLTKKEFYMWVEWCAADKGII